MFEISTTVIALAFFVNLVTWYFEPFCAMRDTVYNYLTTKVIKNRVITFVYNVFSCPTCLAFWAHLIYTQDIINALIFSFIATIIQKILSL